MRITSLVSTILVGALAACASPEFETVKYNRITSEGDFVAQVADKDLRVAKSQQSSAIGSILSINSDGTISGKLAGVSVSGTWDWQVGTYCSEVTMGSTVLPYHCKEAWISGKYFRLSARLDPSDYAYYEIQ